MRNNSPKWKIFGTFEFRLRCLMLSIVSTGLLLFLPLLNANDTAGKEGPGIRQSPNKVLTSEHNPREPNRIFVRPRPAPIRLSAGKALHYKEPEKTLGLRGKEGSVTIRIARCQPGHEEEPEEVEEPPPPPQHEEPQPEEKEPREEERPDRQRDADDERIKSRDRAREGLGYDDIGEEDETPSGPQGPAISDQINDLSSMIGCKDGDERYPDNVIKVAKWTLPDKKPPKIDMTPAANGGYAIDGVEDFMDGVKTPPILTPRTPYHMVVKYTADKIIKAGKRLSDKNKNNLVDIKITIFKVNVEVECAKVQVCKNRKWVDAGFKPKPKGNSKITKAFGSTFGPFNGVRGSEINTILGKLRTKMNQLAAVQKRYEADPCAGASSSAGGGGPSVTTGDKGKARNCQPILTEIRKVEGELKTVTNAHADAQIPVLDLKIEKGKAELARIEEKAKVKKKIPAAEKELELARAALKRLKDNEENVPQTNKLQYVRAVQKAEERVKTAESALKALHGQLKAIDAKYDAKIQKINGEIDTAQKEVDRLAKEKASLRAKIETLWNKYNDCIQGK